MSHVALQRVMVRMLYDPRFTDRVLADPGAALANEDLTAEERQLLLRPDRRAWKIDPDRPRRSLSVLLQEYPTAFALAVRDAGGIDPLEPFFASARFHRVVQDRGSMALAFGDHLCDLVETGTLRDRRIHALARLEQSIAKLRRRSPSPVRREQSSAAAPAGGDPPAPAPQDSISASGTAWGARPGAGAPAAAGSDPPATQRIDRWMLSPDKMLDRAPTSTADLHEEIHRAFTGRQGDLAQLVLDGSVRLSDRSLDFETEEHLLLELVRDDGPRVKYAVGVTEITQGLFDLLRYAADPRTFADLREEIIRLGAEADDAPEIIEVFIGDDTLVGVRA